MTFANNLLFTEIVLNEKLDDGSNAELRTCLSLVVGFLPTRYDLIAGRFFETTVMISSRLQHRVWVFYISELRPTHQDARNPYVSV